MSPQTDNDQVDIKTNNNLFGLGVSARTEIVVELQIGETNLKINLQEDSDVDQIA